MSPGGVITCPVSGEREREMAQGWLSALYPLQGAGRQGISTVQTRKGSPEARSLPKVLEGSVAALSTSAHPRVLPLLCSGQKRAPPSHDPRHRVRQFPRQKSK